MPRLKWDETGKKFYETGLSHCVLFVQNTDGTHSAGVPWNGLTSMSDAPSGADITKLYANNGSYGALQAAEDYGGTIGAYTYPDEFMECDGTKEIVAGAYIHQQVRKSFAMVYQTIVGNDVAGDNLGYKLHFVYGAKAKPSTKDWKTKTDSPENQEFSWEFETVSQTITAMDDVVPTSTITVDSRTISADILSKLEGIVYGQDADTTTSAKDQTSRIPTINDLIRILNGKDETEYTAAA